MLDLWAELFPDGTRLRIMPVGRNLLWSLIRNGESATEESLSGIHVPGRTEHGID